METEEISEMTDGAAILRRWEEEHTDPQHDPVPILTRLAEIIEADTESYMKMDPDPFDERHPSRADPTCNLGTILKIIFRKDNFMTKLVNDYLRDNYFARLGINRDVRKLNIAACRLMLDLTPGLETSAVFETPNNDALVQRLINWATDSPEPLQTYATGLLSAAMEVQDIAVAFRDKNAQLIPLMLQRLHRLQARACEERRQAAMNPSRPFAHLGSKSDCKLDSGHSPAITGRKEAAGLPSSAASRKDAARSQAGKNGMMRPPHSAGHTASPIVNESNESRRSESIDEGEIGDFCSKNVELMEGITHLPATPTPVTKDPPWNRYPMSPPYNAKSKFTPKNADLVESIAQLPGSVKDSSGSPMISPPHTSEGHQVSGMPGYSPASPNYAPVSPCYTPESPSHAPTHYSEGYGVLSYYPPGYNKSPPYMELLKTPKNSDLMESIARALGSVKDSSGSPMMSPPHTSVVIRRSPFTSGTGNVSECSNSSWAEMENVVIGFIQMHPLTLATQQMFILRYLTHMGEYQEFLSHIFENNALELILSLTNLRESRDARLAFEALKYLAALLCHKKFSIEFINMQGLQRLLEVPRPSIAATGVSICLYYLAYCEDAIERVCLLPQHVISDLVRYVLWLLECSHDSGRCHATMFFGLSFQFRVILEEFDAQNGLCKLYNVASTLPIMSTEGEAMLNEDQVCSARQIVRHVCVALKRYFEAHLYIRADQLRRAHMRENDDARQMHNTLPSYKASKSSPEEVQEQVETLLELMSFRAHWQPADELLRLGGITMLLQVIAFAYEWNYSGRAETVRSALDVLSICSVMPQVQLLFCEPVTLPDEGLTVGVNIILGAAEGEIVSDADVQRSALSVIINCVCAPIQRVGGTVARYAGSGYARKKSNFRVSEDVIKKMWDSVRANNGIMVLLTLMMVKIPITDADSIRALACRALAGLARSETVRQIISKLPLFSNGLLQNLMQNPILQDKRQEHVRFQKYALELLEQISGKSKPTGNEFEISLANIHKANVIAQTRIQFNDKQLHQLIYEHLMSRGLTESAATLLREAGISAPKSATPSLTFSYQRSATPSNVRPRLGGSPLIHRPQLASPCNNPPALRSNSVGTTPSSSLNNTPSLSSAQQSATDTPPSVPIKINLANQRRTESVSMVPSSNSLSRSLQKSTSYDSTSTVQSPLQKSATASVLPAAKQEKHVTLDSIITEYLTNQHALCKNPMAICPQFNLFAPHKCPDPKSKNSAPTNFSMRYLRRPIHPAHGGPDGFRLDRRLVHTRFCPVRTFRPAEDESYFTCCTYMPDNQHLIVGAYRGELKIYNLTNTTESSVQCHDSYMFHLMPHKTGKLLLASCTWNSPLSSMWKITPGGGADGSLTMERSTTWEEEEYVEFSKQEQDRVITTNAQTATIYDVETGQVIQTLKPQVSNQYLKNRATFNPTNEIVLSDGVLWDVNAGKEIHKLDKLNQNISGLFHPNGLEIVANTEVWDLRTFHLLRTVPTLDQCNVLFSPDGTTIYTSTVEQDGEEQDNGLESSFRTLDAYDYSPIATIDVKKNIYNLACNPYGTQIAVVENLGVFDQTEESSVRLYDVGRRRDDEDEVDEEDEDEEMESDDSDDDNLDGNELRDLADIVGDFSDMDGASDNGDDDDEDDDDDVDVEDDDGDGDENGENGEAGEDFGDGDGTGNSDESIPTLDNSSAPSDSADDW